MTRTGGNKKEAARLLNLKRTTLIEKIKKKSGEDLETD
jgi:DNA-binding NtrC family response regulator